METHVFPIAVETWKFVALFLVLVEYLCAAQYRKWEFCISVRPNEGSDVLQQLEVPIIPLANCSAVPVYKTVELNEEHICAGGEPNKDSCKGDSGGPLVIMRPLEGHAQFFLIGIVSFGTPYCGYVPAPGVYTRITHYLDWILENVHEWTACCFFPLIIYQHLIWHYLKTHLNEAGPLHKHVDFIERID